MASCIGCSKLSTTKQRQAWLKCTTCDSTRCQTCSKGLKFFVCGNCDASEEDFRNFVRQEIQFIKESIATQFTDIRKEIQALKPPAEASGSVSGGNSYISNAVHAEVDKKEMEKCLVLSGLSEFSEDSDERMTFGELQAEVTNSLLICDPSFNPDHLDTCLRMGIFDPQRKRLVKIVLRSVHVQRQIMSGSTKTLFSKKKLRIRPSKPLEERRKDSALIKQMFDHNNKAANKKNPVKIDWKEKKLVTAKDDPDFNWTVKIFKDPFARKSTDARPGQNESFVSTNSEG